MGPYGAFHAPCCASGPEAQQRRVRSLQLVESGQPAGWLGVDHGAFMVNQLISWLMSCCAYCVPAVCSASMYACDR